ncbi:MAG: aminodeoxychorismate synthase component I [Candidatus Eisenbacteria bacterium]
MEFHSALPLVEAIEVSDPLAAARSLANLPHPFLLHSAATDERARWSFFGADPFAVFTGADYDGARAMWRRLHAQTVASDPIPTLVPFTGGVVGYWAYDFGRRLERLPELAADDLGLPEVLLGFYDVVGAFDHETRQAWLFSSGLPLDEELRAGRARDRLAQFADLLSAGRRSTVRLPQRREEVVHLRSTFTPDEYRAAVERVKECIRAGDIFQANLSQRWSLPVDMADPTTLALALTEALDLHSPAPYAAFLGAPDHAVASASPERFLELRGRRVETRPIKGTRPRGADAEEDARLRAELQASAKDRAENVMIVDVLRNDLGRVCETGSVAVEGLCELEVFPQVFHLTSTVTGVLRGDRDAFDLLHACFPGGSITGAPKIRAMEILETLEPVRRHLYTGSIGYIDWGGDADWNIAIRTAIVTPAAVHVAAGGGITADSDADAEYRETLHKAEGLRLALERVAGPIELAAAMADRG